MTKGFVIKLKGGSKEQYFEYFLNNPKKICFTENIDNAKVFFEDDEIPSVLAGFDYETVNVKYPTPKVLTASGQIEYVTNESDEDGVDEDEDGEARVSITSLGREFLLSEKMSKIPIRNFSETLELSLEDGTLQKLEQLAQDKGRQINELIIEILENAVAKEVPIYDYEKIEDYLKNKQPVLLTAANDDQRIIGKVLPL